MELEAVIALCGCAVAVATFFIGRTSAAKNSGVADGELKSDVKYIKASVDKQESKLDGLVTDYEDVKVELEKLKGRIYSLELKVKMLHGEQ